MKSAQALDLDLESLGQSLGPAGLHEFLDQAFVQPVLQREAGALKRQETIGARANQDACISPKGLFAIEETFDAFAFHDILQKEGVEEMGEDELIKDLRRKCPSVVVRSKPRSNSIIVPATQYTRLVTPKKGLEVVRKTLGKVTIVSK